MKYRIFATMLFASFIFVNGAYAQNTYYLSDIANGNYGGGSYKTTFVLFNNTNTHATATLVLTDDNGNPLTMTITGYGAQSSFGIDLPAGASQMLQTDGKGTVVTGAATVNSTTTIGVSAIFSIYDSAGNYVTETGVGSSDSLGSFVLPVDTTGFFNTGLALFNSSGSAVSITMTLRDTTGQQAGAPVVLPLASGHHFAGFIAGSGQLFPSSTNFRGTLLVQSSAPIAAMVLRQYQNLSTLSFTSLPVASASSTKTTLNLAQVADGGGYQTSFLIFNISSSPATVALTLTKDNGTPLSVTIPGRGTNSTFSGISLAAGGSIFLQTDGSPSSPATGAATITSNVPIGASGVFTVLNAGAFQTETGVGDSSVLTSFTLPVDITGNFNTGVAFFNPSNSTATLTLQRLDATGALVGTSSTQPLSAQGHLAIFVNQIFPDASNFRGSLAVTSTTGIAALTLRMNNPPLSFTTLPVVSGTSSGTGSVSGSASLSKTETGITATSNVTKNETLPSGFKLTGTISGPGQATSVVASAGQSNIFSGSVNQQTGKYTVVLPSGTYNLTVSFVPTGVPSGQSVSVTSSVSGSVQVSGDTTRDITLPAVSLFTVSGTVNGLSNLSSPTGMQIVFASNDGTISAYSSLAANGSYQGVLPAGAYTAGLTASIAFPPSTFQNQSLGIYNLGSASISGNTAIPAFTVPATARLSGTIHGTSLPVIGVSVGATGPSASVTSSSTADLLTAQYQMILPKNTTYGVNLSMSLVQGTTYLGSITFPVPAQSLSLGADTANYDFTVPTLPGYVTISGRVTDSSGNPVSGAVVSAISQSITGTPNLLFSTVVQADAGGNYSMSVLSGTNYQLVFTPISAQ
jgi:hypothetical protein